MRVSFFLAVSIATALVSFRSAAAEPIQDNKVDLTVVKYGDHVQLECNPISLATAMRSDWKTICNQMAALQVQGLAAAGTIAPVKGDVFDLSASGSAGPMLTRSIALLKPHL